MQRYSLQECKMQNYTCARFVLLEQNQQLGLLLRTMRVVKGRKEASSTLFLFSITVVLTLVSFIWLTVHLEAQINKIP